MPIPNLRPSLEIDESRAAEYVVQRLVHLTRYRNIQQFDNTNPLSALSGELIVDLLGKYTGESVGQQELLPFENPGNVPMLKPGEWTALRIKNTSQHVLNITVLDLTPDWSITQIYPQPEDSYFMPFGPGHQEVLKLQAYLPEGYTEAVDTLKVFATVGSANFRWLELPALDQPYRSKNTLDTCMNSLDQLLAGLASEESPARNLTTAIYSVKEWTTVQLEVKVEL